MNFISGRQCGADTDIQDGAAMGENRGIKGKAGEQTGEQINNSEVETLYPCGFQGIIRALSHHMNQGLSAEML